MSTGMELLGPFDTPANFFPYGAGLDQSSPEQRLPPAVSESPGPFPRAPPSAPNESPATKSKLREQLERLREKRTDMIQNRIPEITSALRDVLEGATAEIRKEKMESCLDMIKQLSD